MSIDISRRRMFRSALGFPALAAAALADSATVRQPHFPPTAKSVIFLFMHGGPSHLETFDPKPALNRLDGQHVPASFGTVQLQFSKFERQTVLGCRRVFRRFGRAGIEVSDLFPEVARHIDDIAVVRQAGSQSLRSAWIELFRGIGQRYCRARVSKTARSRKRYRRHGRKRA